MNLFEFYVLKEIQNNIHNYGVINNLFKDTKLNPYWFSKNKKSAKNTKPNGSIAKKKNVAPTN